MGIYLIHAKRADEPFTAYHDFHYPSESKGGVVLSLSLFHLSKCIESLPGTSIHPSIHRFNARVYLEAKFTKLSPPTRRPPLPSFIIAIKADMIGPALQPRLSGGKRKVYKAGVGYRKVASSSVQVNAAEPLSPCTMTWYMTRAAIIIVEWHSKPSGDVPCDWPRGGGGGGGGGQTPFGQGLVIGAVHPHNLAPR